MSGNIAKDDIIKVLERRYDFQSARNVLTRALKDNDLSDKKEYSSEEVDSLRSYLDETGSQIGDVVKGLEELNSGKSSKSSSKSKKSSKSSKGSSKSKKSSKSSKGSSKSKKSSKSSKSSKGSSKSKKSSKSSKSSKGSSKSKKSSKSSKSKKKSD